MTKISAKSILRSATCVSAFALLGTAANAQEVPAQEETTTAAVQGVTAAPVAKEDAIVVTGSRIRRADEFNSASPISIIDPVLSTRSGQIDTAEMVQGSPIASGSSQVTSAISSNFVTNGGFGAQTISLRGLGAERTLVLLNGRRAGPAGTRGAVSAFDLNVLPQTITQRVDILKDGASSIYGSDAVAGVVNLITKKDTNGIELDGFASVPLDTGGEQYSLSATWGKKFDRGHILIAGNYFKREELKRGQRKYLQCDEDYVFTDETFKTRADAIDPRTGKFACTGPLPWGHVWTYDYSYYYSPNGSNIPGSQGIGDVTLFQYNYPGDNLGSYIPTAGPRVGPGQIAIPAGWYPVGYDPASYALQNNYHPFMDQDTVIPSTERFTVYLDASYELTDNLEVYTELLFNRRKTYQNGSRQIWQFGFGEFFDYYYDYDENGLDSGDPTSGFGGDPLAPGWGGAATFSPTGYTDQADNSQRVDYYRAVVGLKGGIGSNWRWDLVSQYSKSDGNYSTQQTLADSIASQDFRSGSCVGTTTSVAGKQCIDLPWYDPYFLRGEMTQQQKDFLFEWETGNTQYTQWYVEATIDNKELFRLPGGPVGLALGVTYRQDKINDTPGAITLADNAWGNTGAGITAGKTQTAEAFGEINIPIMTDKPLFQSLEFSGAARVTNVKSIRASDGLSDADNGNLTYKLGLNWQVNDWLRLRGTYGTSYRAPALFEQFLANQTSFPGQRDIDPCIQWANNLAQGNITQQFANNCAADGVPGNHTGAGIEATAITGGGIGVLEPETSRAWTASIILSPKLSFLPDTRVSLALDYFDIEVNGEIAQLGAGNIISGCYSSDFFPNEPLCDLFQRNDDTGTTTGGSPSNINNVRDSFINVNSQKNRGIDATVRIVHDFGGDAKLTLQSQMTWQLEDQTALFSGQFEDDNGEAGEPKWTGDFNALLDVGPWSLLYGLDIVGGTDDRADYLADNGTLCPTFTTFPGPVCLDLTTDAQFYHSFSVTREINKRFEITLGMTNISDVKPPRVSQVGGNGVSTLGKGVIYSQYDLVGRRAFINMKVKY